MHRAPSALSILALTLVLAGCPASQRDAVRRLRDGSPEIDRIEQLEDQRSLGGGELLTFARSGRPEVRARALWALGRIQDPAAVHVVIAALADPEALVRGEAAFAAGLLGQSWDPLPPESRDALVGAVVRAEDTEREVPVRLRMLEALGKLGSVPAEDRLRDRAHDKDDRVRARAALSLGLIARREGKIDDRSVVAAFGLIGPFAPQALRYAGAYLLAFSKAPTVRPALAECLDDGDGEVRALCARGFGEVGLSDDVPLLEARLTDSDVRVVVEATRALIRITERCPPEVTACPAVDALKKLRGKVAVLERGEVADGLHPLLALAQAGLPARGKAVLAELRAELGQALARAPSNSDLAWLDCRFAAAQDKLAQKLEASLACGGDAVAAPRRLALGLREVARGLPEGGVPEATWRPWVEHLDHPAAVVKTGALEALAAAKAKDAAQAVRALLASPDPIVAINAGLTAAALGDRSAYSAIRAMAEKVNDNLDLVALADPIAELAQPLDPHTAEEEAEMKARADDAQRFLRGWLSAAHPNVRSAAARALAKLTGQPVTPAFVPGPARGELPQAPRDATLTFHTPKGQFVVKLDTLEASLTSANLFALAKKGYFDGLTFHRVVPDFVVQGGDPRGDGEGGPGWAIRCEITHVPYRRGSFGMALSGKDTGGSQFFVPHSAQPHLDGRYTNFGEVVSGMEVVDRLSEGDVMTQVVATP